MSYDSYGKAECSENAGHNEAQDRDNDDVAAQRSGRPEIVTCHAAARRIGLEQHDPQRHHTDRPDRNRHERMTQQPSSEPRETNILRLNNIGSGVRAVVVNAPLIP